MMIAKEKCFCSESPAMTLCLLDPERYESEGDIPDHRIYNLLCIDCGHRLATYVTENTISAVKELRDQMDTLYGKSVTIFPMPTLKESMQRLGIY